MRTIKLDDKGHGIEAIRHFALSISQGDNFDYAFESGELFTDTKADINSYCLMAAMWKEGQLKVEVKKMRTDKDFNITKWETILV